MTAHVRQHNGTPTVFLDGKPVFASYMWGHSPTSKEYSMTAIARSYAEAGIHFYDFDVGAGGPEPEWCGPAPDRENHFDFSTVQARFGRILDADPDARFHLRVYMEMNAQWWKDMYPDEREVDDSGQPLTQSFASRIWREQAKQFLREYIAYLQAIGLADRVIAYQTGAGHTGEWVKGLTSMRTPCGDYSQPMRRQFRDWLRVHYANDVAQLRAAWANPDVTFDTAEVPPASAQWQTTHGSFRDPRREQAVIDYYHSLADLCGDLIIDFNRTVKEATNGQALAGAFYGYLLELAWNAGFFSEGPDSDYTTTQRSGHLGLAKVLRSPYVDFLVSPYSYGYRGIGGHGAPMPPTESARLHGKLYIFEEDSRTYLAPPNAGFGRTDSLSDSVAVLQRNMAEVLTRGMGIWWSSGSSHIDPIQEPAFQPLLKRFQELGTFALHLDRQPAAEIAVLLDDESFFYESIRNELDLPLIFQQRLWGLPKLGAPADYYLLQDLLEDRLPPYKLYVFLNPFHLDASRRQALRERLCRDGRVALWIYAPGYLADEPDIQHMTDLTGFQFAQGDYAWGPLMHVTDFDHPITQDLPQDLVWGTNSRLCPLFHLDDPQARILGQVVYSQGRCRPGLGVKPFPTWTSVYCAAPNLPAPLLRGIARFAGVHLYNEQGDVLYATPQLLGVHTVEGGERTFQLPQQAEAVYDLFGQRLLAERVRQFQVILPPRSTALFYTGNADLLNNLPERWPRR